MAREERRPAPEEAPGPSSGSRPILIIQTTQGVDQIVDACAASWAAGIRPGMTLAHARALVPGLSPPHVEKHDAARDAAALVRLAHWGLRFTPLVMPEPPDGLRLDVDGCTHLFGGSGRLAEAVRCGVERLGFSARVAIAPTHGLAWAMARFGDAALGPSMVIPAGRPSDPHHLRRPLESMPVAALRIDARTRLGLAEVGIRSVGEVFALPRRQIVDRFGPEIAQRLDQATGHAFEPIEPVRPREAIVEERVFSGPVRSAEGIALATRDLLEQLERTLARRELGVTAARLRYRRADLDPVDEAIVLSRPARSARHLWSLLRVRVESVHMGYGIESIALTAVRTARIAHDQQERWTAQERTRSNAFALGALIDTLHARLGADRVLRPRLDAGHMPEKSWSTAPYDGGEPPPRDRFVTLAPRPSRLMRQPEPIDVTCDDRQAADMPTTMARRGRERRLITAIGPERIGHAWWSADPARERSISDGPESAVEAATLTRAYYRVQDEVGLWWWIYRTEPGGRWYLHGLWG